MSREDLLTSRSLILSNLRSIESTNSDLLHPALFCLVRPRLLSCVSLAMACKFFGCKVDPYWFSTDASCLFRRNSRGSAAISARAFAIRKVPIKMYLQNHSSINQCTVVTVTFRSLSCSEQGCATYAIANILPWLVIGTTSP